jgi:hypothetical protein
MSHRKRNWKLVTISATGATTLVAAVVGNKILVRRILVSTKDACSCYLMSASTRITPVIYLAANGAWDMTGGEELGITTVAGELLAIYFTTAAPTNDVWIEYDLVSSTVNI